MPPQTAPVNSDAPEVNATIAVQETVKPVEQSLFRQAALDAYIKGSATEGAVFEAEPIWIRSSYLFLLGGLAVLILFVAFARVNEYASGPVVVQVGEQQEITAVIDSNIGEILVTQGEEVKAGQAVLQLYQAQAIADYQRLKKEFELRLRQRLMAPDDVSVESALVALHADMDQAKANIDQRIIYAETDGLVGDIRIRPGQRISAGQTLMSLVERNDNTKVTLLLPGKYRPQVEKGMQLQLTLDGYPYSIQYLPIDTIGDEVIGPAEARQFLGTVIADGMQIEGANFIVQAKIDGVNFTSEEQVYLYHNGMHGVGEVKVLSEPILITLFPSLKKFF